uniref:F-box only protein 50 n=1 Tax=Pogona vitticeps TaxID=103695 RepID=A0ABM5EST6_9SAUR
MASQHQRRQPASPPDSPAEPHRFEARWELSRRGVAGPPEPAEGWQALQPFERNLLRNPNPEGVNISEPAPPCLPQAPCKPMDFEDIFRGWQVSVEPVPAEDEEAPSKLTSPCYRWCIKQQRVDLLAEGLWEALLDQYQPNITIMDWYENSNLAPPVYELHIRLLGTTEAAVIREFHYVASLKERDGKNKDWHHVSHVFQDYGPGVRYVHFLHKTKEAETPAGLLRTRVTDSSVSVQLRD